MQVVVQLVKGGEGQIAGLCFYILYAFTTVDPPNCWDIRLKAETRGQSPIQTEFPSEVIVRSCHLVRDEFLGSQLIEGMG